MSSYSEFAGFYDSLMCDVDYEERTEYLLSLFEKYGKVPTLLLDLACGTGGFSNQMARKGIDVIGVDASEEMLSLARENSALLGTDVLYLCQTAKELDLYGTVNGAICCMDSLNHITALPELKAAIKKVSLFLEPDCLFIFDVNTPYKHKEILGNNTFVIEQDEVYCVWQNEYDSRSRITDISLDFFRETDGVYERSSEYFSERAYTAEQLRKISEDAGFTVLKIFCDMTEMPITDRCDRAIYVLKKLR